jgi:zinc transport system substrate-binding protein
MLSRRLWLSCLALSPVAAVLFAGCSSHEDVWAGKGGPPRVVVTFPPLVSFVKAVGGEHVGVISLCTDTGPHEYQYNATEIIGLREADLFLANGLGLDNQFADKLNRNVNNADKLLYVKLGDKFGEGKGKVPLLAPRPDHDEKDEGDHKHDHHHGDHDPHIWLGIPQAIKMVEEICDALKQVDRNKAHHEDYDKNAKEYIGKLKQLEADGKALMAKKKIKLVSFHDSLEYFAATYGVTIVDVIEINVGDTPTAKQLGDLVEACQKEKVEIIAVEPQFPKSSSARTLQDELKSKKQKVKLIEIDPLETYHAKKDKFPLDAEWYEKKVRANLEALAKPDPVEEAPK